MATDKKTPKGMPIYLDKTDRQFASFDSQNSSPTWYPSNRPAHKLWRCVEALRDLKSILELIGSSSQDSTRKIKIAATQLHTLATTVHDLCNYFSGDETIKKEFSSKEVNIISRVSHELKSNVPVRVNSDFDKLRNKLSAHVDAELYPSETRALAESLSPSSFYVWLVHSVKGLIELTNINVYHWSCESNIPDSISLMCTEPYVTTIQLQPEPRLISFNIANGSPRNEIPSICSEILTLAEWMRSPETPMLKLKETPQPGF